MLSVLSPLVYKESNAVTVTTILKKATSVKYQWVLLARLSLSGEFFSRAGPFGGCLSILRTPPFTALATSQAEPLQNACSGSAFFCQEYPVVPTWWIRHLSKIFDLELGAHFIGI